MKRKAFTLIELIVVITIIAILASVALPVIKKVGDRQNQAAAQVQFVKGSCVGIITQVTQNLDNKSWTTSVAPNGGQPLDMLIPAGRTDLAESVKTAMREGKRVEVFYQMNNLGYQADSIQNL